MLLIFSCLIVLFASPIVVSRSHRPAKGSCQLAAPFDTAMLAVTYGPGFCSTKSCRVKPLPWSIHGLWPNLRDGSYQQSCCFPGQFNETTLNPIMDEMKEYWPSLTQSNWQFWRHEWNKHGTCATKSKFNGEINYFRTGLDLFQRLKINEWLEAEGIKLGGVYDKEKVRNAIIQGFGHHVEFSCKKSKKRRGHAVPTLLEIRFCYNPNTLQQIACPVVKRNGCKSASNTLSLPLL